MSACIPTTRVEIRPTAVSTTGDTAVVRISVGSGS